MKSERGFTITELMITVAVAVIILTMAIPSFQTTFERNRMRSAAEKLYADIQFAHTQAIKENTNMFMEFTVGNNWCYGIDDNAAGCDCSVPATNANACLVDNGKRALSANELRNITLATGLTGGVTAIQFEPRRGMPDVNGSITLTSDGGLTGTITLNAVGRVQLDYNF